MTKPKQIDPVEILNDDDRIFKSWGTVEVRDKEGDLIPINEFKKIMPTLMDRGGNISDRHTNRMVAKILNYEFAQKETDEGLKDGIMITGKVFKNYKLDDMIWEGVKTGIYKGLSFGGRNHKLDTKYEKGLQTNILKQLEGFEFALVPGMGNQEATMEEINYLAKCDKEIEKYDNDFENRLKKVEDKLEINKQLDKEEIKKTFGGFTDFDSCVSQNQDKDDPKAFCGFLKDRIEKAENDYNDDKDINKSLTKNDLSLSPNSDKNEKYLKNSDYNNNMVTNDVKKEDVIETPATPESPTNPMEEIKNMLSQILQAVQSPAPVAPMVQKADHEDEDEEKVEKEDEKDKEEEKEKVEKANGSEGEKSVTLPKVPAEETGEGKPAQGGEDDKVKFVEKEDLNAMKNEIMKEIKKGLFNKEATTPRPANEIKKEVNKAPTNWQDVKKMLRDR